MAKRNVRPDPVGVLPLLRDECLRLLHRVEGLLLQYLIPALPLEASWPPRDSCSIGVPGEQIHDGANRHHPQRKTPERSTQTKWRGSAREGRTGFLRITATPCGFDRPRGSSEIVHLCGPHAIPGAESPNCLQDGQEGLPDPEQPDDHQEIDSAVSQRPMGRHTPRGYPSYRFTSASSSRLY